MIFEPETTTTEKSEVRQLNEVKLRNITANTLLYTRGNKEYWWAAGEARWVHIKLVEDMQAAHPGKLKIEAYRQEGKR